jgi:hypothetical protein
MLIQLFKLFTMECLNFKEKEKNVMNELLVVNKNLPANLPKEYQGMVENINTHYPALKRDSNNFYKSHSQFMQFTLDVTCLTQIRSLKQILAEINNTKMALEESHYNLKKKRIEMKKKEKLLQEAKDDLDKEMLEVEIDELGSQIMNTSDYVMGAIRKMSSFVTQYNNIMESMGKTELTEQDYEEDEEKYHIMTAFSQGLHAARAHGGYIDEGNQIYIFQLGINGTQAQAEVSSYLNSEMDFMAKGGTPPHDNTLKWLEALAEKYKGCSRKYLQHRGMIVMDEKSLHNEKRKE